jgi:hypothetical protein
VSLKHIPVLLKPLNNGTAVYGDDGSALLKTSNVSLVIGVICQCRPVSFVVRKSPKVFQIRKAVPYVAEVLHLSRATMYNRRGAVRQKRAA